VRAPCRKPHIREEPVKRTSSVSSWQNKPHVVLNAAPREKARLLKDDAGSKAPRVRLDLTFEVVVEPGEVFPAPDGPIRQSVSPGWIAMRRSRTASTGSRPARR
jgi:hypothetical protein